MEDIMLFLKGHSRWRNIAGANPVLWGHRQGALFTLLWAEVWPVGWCEGRPLREPRMELNPSPHGRAPRAKDNNRTLRGSSRGLAAVGIMKQNPRPNRTRVGCREPHRGRGHGMWCGLPCLGTYGGQRSPLSCNVTGSHSERH